jgi:hypothetical protein
MLSLTTESQNLGQPFTVALKNTCRTRSQKHALAAPWACQVDYSTCWHAQGLLTLLRLRL